jgi:hypothetical protein
MGNKNKANVQLVISHFEGCSGNFLGRLFANRRPNNQDLFRIDGDLNPLVLAINGRDNWESELLRLENHYVIVTHNFDQHLIQTTFPNARTVSIYPYTHVGNVLYNICFKKLNNKLPNMIDNYLIHLIEWYARIRQNCPKNPCIDFWELTNLQSVESLLNISLTHTQKQFFKDYWKQQLEYELDIPSTPQSIEQLLDTWKITNWFNDWSVAWTIFVYELINNKLETQRLWSIDIEVFRSWQDVQQIQTRYNNLTLPVK